MPDRARSQLHNYDPGTGRLSVWDDEIDVDMLAAELIKIARASGPRPFGHGEGTDAA